MWLLLFVLRTRVRELLSLCCLLFGLQCMSSKLYFSHFGFAVLAAAATNRLRKPKVQTRCGATAEAPKYM